MLSKIKEKAFVLSGKIISSTNSTVIFYHDVHMTNKRHTAMSTPIDLFKKHIQIIRAEGFNIVPQIERPKKEVRICFDDGFRGIYDNKDYFVEQQIYPTVFLAITLIGNEGYLTESEILELQELGFIFESHACSHLDLTSFKDNDLRYELETSKTYLEALLKKTVNEICFPIGYFSDRVLKFCKDAGYNIFYSSLPGNYYNKRNDGLIYRNLVQFASSSEFKAIINGAMNPFYSWYERKQYVQKDPNR